MNWRFTLFAAVLSSLLLSTDRDSRAKAAVDISQGVKLTWLDQTPPAVSQGVSWGVPWPQGAVSKTTTFGLTDAAGKAVPVQSWPLAYWPDGSMKWTGFAALGDRDLGNSLMIHPGAATVAPQVPLNVTDSSAAIEITNGNTTWRIAKTGANLVESITIGKTIVARDGKLVCQLEDRSDWETKQTLRIESFTSQIDQVTLEQTGPVRAVVKIEGRHKADAGDRMWMPFIVRLYFFAGSDAVRMIHTFIFDGDQDKDFIHSIGIRFSVPMREEFINRHVRLAGDQGFFAEPTQIISNRRGPGPDYAAQIAGQRVPNIAQLPGGNLVEQMAVWDAYRLTQPTPDGFNIEKRTNPKSPWLRCTGGQRSLGMAFVGDVSGGLSVDLKNFWKLYPTELEIQNASKDAATLTVWLYSPEAAAMDLRHYDTVAHGLNAAYEDVQPGFSTPFGIARTSELTFRPSDHVPSDADLLSQVQADQQGALLVCSPEYFHDLQVFGIWSLPDTSTPGKKWIEDQLAKAITFYQGQVEERKWYGFWDFGDVMHTYDAGRHEWRYDVGGFAWADTELVPNLWLWYSFLRTGRADVFHMAEAMTRQSQECDVYHIGPMAGLGSRHNVQHWGDGAKEVRISQSLLKRPYYYLTTDERTGDLMNEEINADQALLKVDPLRELAPVANFATKYPTHVRIGPDWFALVSNWYTAWERTGDTKYRDKIMVGINCITAFPNGISSGENFGYDPASGKLFQMTATGTPSLLTLFGGPELNFEIDPVINDPAWSKAWLAYCQDFRARGPDNARMAAYAASMNKDSAKAAQAWDSLLHSPGLGLSGQPFDSHKVVGATVPEPLDEITGISTNSTSQWCLNAIELLQLVGDQMPANDPVYSGQAAPANGRGGANPAAPAAPAAPPPAAAPGAQ
jgi:hypothetical protein